MPGFHDASALIHRVVHHRLKRGVAPGAGPLDHAAPLPTVALEARNTECAQTSTLTRQRCTTIGNAAEHVTEQFSLRDAKRLDNPHRWHETVIVVQVVAEGD